MRKPNYEPFEFHDSPELADIVEEQKEKYGLKLEKGKFYSREHFEMFWGLVQRGVSIERLWCMGTFLACMGGSLYGVPKIVPYLNDGLLGALELLVTGYCAILGAVAITDTLLPFYEKMSSKVFNKSYRQYCENNNIPYDTI